MIHKRDNRGFSLVELIIVIAIMAILIGVLAPAYLRYVEKARKSSDADAIAACMNAMETVALDPEYSAEIDTHSVINLKITNDKLDFVAINMNTLQPLSGVETALKSIIHGYELKSQDWKAHSSRFRIYITITDEGRIEYALEDFDDADTKLADFSPSIKAKMDRIIP